MMKGFVVMRPSRAGPWLFWQLPTLTRSLCALTHTHTHSICTCDKHSRSLARSLLTEPSPEKTAARGTYNTAYNTILCQYLLYTKRNSSRPSNPIIHAIKMEKVSVQAKVVNELVWIPKAKEFVVQKRVTSGSFPKEKMAGEVGSATRV